MIYLLIFVVLLIGAVCKYKPTFHLVWGSSYIGNYVPMSRPELFMFYDSNEKRNLIKLL